MAPLPSYTQKWNGEVKRVTREELRGLQYDRSIPISSIFWLKKAGAERRTMVVRSRCANCRALNLPCVRRDPCNNCKAGRLRCTYPDNSMGLPERPVPGPPDLMIPQGSEILCETLDAEIEQSPVKEATDSRTVRSRHSTSLTGERKGQKPAIDPENNIKRNNVPDGQLSDEPPMKRRRMTSAPGNTRGKTTWTRINMTTTDVKAMVERSKPPRRPYIWSENYLELLSGIPFMSTVNNGVSADIGAPPMILIDDELWSGAWNGGTVIHLTTTHIFSYQDLTLKSLTDQADGPSVVPGHTESDEENLSDMELMYPIESDSESVLPEAPSKSAPLNTQPVASSSWNSDLFGSYPARLDDDSVRMYLPSPPNSRTTHTIVQAEKEPSEAPLPLHEELEKLNLTTVRPEDYPEEIETLFKAYEGGIPVSMVSDTTWRWFPFKVVKQCRFAVLGFFHITDVESNVQVLPPTATKRPRVRGQITWTFTFRWTPGGPLDPSIPLDVDGRPKSSPEVPWWISSESDLDCFPPPASQDDFLEPYLMRGTIISAIILRDAFEDGNARADASQRAWYCVRCGKLNLTNWIGAYVCSFCPRDEKTLPWVRSIIHPGFVRDRQRFIPMWDPSTQLPDGVTQTMDIFGDELRRFTFTINLENPLAVQTGAVSGVEASDPASTGTVGKSRKWKGKGKEIYRDDGTIDVMTRSGPSQTKGLVAELLFLGNRESLEGDANRLFVDFQEGVPMHFERVESRPTAGVYTYRVSPDGRTKSSQDEGYSTWSHAPVPIQNAREKIIDYAIRYASKRDIRDTLLHLSVMAWLGESPVKTEIQAKATNHCVILMCLGADLDLIFSKLDEEQQQKKLTRKKSKVNVQQDDANEFSKAGRHAEIWGDGEGRETNKALMATDRLRITLTHGSMLILSGCNVNVTVIRSEFAMLLKLYDGL